MTDTLEHPSNSASPAQPSPQANLDGGQLTTTYGYDSYSVLTSINAGGNTLSISPLYINSLGTGYAQRSINAVGVETDALGKATSFTLDPSGNLVQVTSPKDGQALADNYEQREEQTVLSPHDVPLA